ncbi:hypothetical protein ACHAXR_008260 [Thalassiosira sp. AJA248-18]
MKGMSAHRPSFQPNRHSKSFLKSYDGGIGSGILSPALSASGSTTVTPITPMTPLTTPRTPLQILLGRQATVGVGGGAYKRPSMPRHQNSNLSDEEEDQYREKQLLALQLFANFLNTAETTLNDITERENAGHGSVLGPGIVRVCNDLAQEIEGVARELHKEHIQAAQHLEHVRNDHGLSLIEEGDNSGMEEKTSEVMDVVNETAMALSNLHNSESASSFQSHEEFITTLSTTHTLLLDMAAALRAVTQQEAQELGEVALEVARMFVWSLGVVHGNMIQMTVTNDSHHSNSSLECENQPMEKTDGDGGTKQHRVTWLGPVVEILDEEEKKDEFAMNHTDTPPKNTTSLRYTPQLPPIPSSPNKLSTTTAIDNMSVRHAGERVRVLWPPLLPAVTEASKHCANSAKEHPIPAIAIGLTCGPAAIATAVIAGPPLLVADWAIQQSYDALSEHTPVIENVEKGAANALQVARLGILCSKLIVKQGMAVGERQIERRGGIGKVCSDAVGEAVDMALHPVETAGMAWGGLWWMGGAVRDAVGFVKETVSGGELRMDIH